MRSASPAESKFLSTANDDDTNKNMLPSNSTGVFSSSKRLGFFADKLYSKCRGLLVYIYTRTYIIIRRLLVLSSQSRQRPVTFSLTTPTPQPTAREAAISDLLCVVRNPWRAIWLAALRDCEV